MSIVKEITSIASIAMPLLERWNVRRCRYAPEGGAAGRICIASGIHGDEMLGQLVAFGVAQRIAAENEVITAEVYDINHFPALREKYNVMSVPCLVVNDGETVSFGKKNIRQLLELLKK